MYRNDIEKCMKQLEEMKKNLYQKEMKQKLSYLILQIEETMEKECGDIFPISLDIHMMRPDFKANDCFYHSALNSLKNSLYFCTQNKLTDASLCIDKAMVQLQFID